MSHTTPTVSELLRLLDSESVRDLLEIAACVTRAEQDRIRADLATAQRRALEAAGQLSLDLSRPEPDVITPCMSPPRSAISDYARWLAAGGGRAVNAICSSTCPCGDTAPWSQHSRAHDDKKAA